MRSAANISLENQVCGLGSQVCDFGSQVCDFGNQVSVFNQLCFVIAPDELMN